MNDWGIYKPLLTTLALPPVPFLVLILLGARLILPRRGLGYLILLAGVAGIWMSTCQVTAVWLQDRFLCPPPALKGESLTRLEQLGRKGSRPGAGAVPSAAILVLGGGREAVSREYGTADLSKYSAERLRYGIWLVRRTGLPLGFSGGVGWAQRSDMGPPEADIAANIALKTYGVPIRWVESQSSDTRGNAALTVAMLSEQHVPEIVLVTDAFHMPRALRDFEQAARRQADLRPGSPVIKVTPAPMGFWQHEDQALFDWMPSISGSVGVRLALKECLAALLKT